MLGGNPISRCHTTYSGAGALLAANTRNTESAIHDGRATRRLSRIPTDTRPPY